MEDFTICGGYCILGDLATLWSLEHDALVLVDVLEDHCYTWRCLLLLGDLESGYLGGAWRLVALHLERICGGFDDDLDAWLHLLMTWRLGA